MTSARILVTRIALHWLKGSDPAVCLGQLYTLLEQPELPCHGGIDAKWQADDVLQALREKLSAEQADFLTALVAVLNDRTRLAELDRFNFWQNQPPVALDVRWPD